MSAHQIDININLDGLSGQLERSLQRIIFLVATSLQNIDQLDHNIMELPTSFKINLCPNLRWSKEDAQEKYSEWILCNGFRDAIEVVGTVLEEAHKVLSVWDMTDKNGTIKISGAK